MQRQFSDSFVKWFLQRVAKGAHGFTHGCVGGVAGAKEQVLEIRQAMFANSGVNGGDVDEVAGVGVGVAFAGHSDLVPAGQAAHGGPTAPCVELAGGFGGLRAASGGTIGDAHADIAGECKHGGIIPGQGGWGRGAGWVCGWPGRDAALSRLTKTERKLDLSAGGLPGDD